MADDNGTDQLSLDNPILNGILAHIASGGSINVQGPSGGTSNGASPGLSAPPPSPAGPSSSGPPPAPGPGAAPADGQPMMPPPPPPIPGFTGFATDPANFSPIAAALNTRKNQPTPFTHPPPPPAAPSIFNPGPNLFPLQSPLSGSSPTPAPSSQPQTSSVASATLGNLGPGSINPLAPSAISGMPSLPVSPSVDVAPAMPGSVDGTQPRAMPNLPQQQVPNAQQGLMSEEEYFAAHPEIAAHPIAQTKWGKALFYLTSAAAGAAGGMHGDPLAGVRYAQSVADYNNSIPDLNQQRYEAGAVKPFQQALTNQETQARISQLNRPENVQTVQTADGVMQRDPQTGVWNKIGDSPSENRPDTPENQFLQDFLKRNPKATIGDALQEYTRVTTKPDQKPDSIEQQYADEYMRRHPGAGIQEAVTAYAAATQKPERGEGGGSYLPMYDQQGNMHFFNPKTGGVVDPPKQFSKTDPSKQNNAYQGIVDEADNAHQLQKMAEGGNAEADADLALSFFKVMKGANGSGIRFTQTEQNLIKNARSSSQDLQGIAQKVIGGGQIFTPQQRKNIVDIIDLHANQARNHLGTSSTPAGAQGSNPATQLSAPATLPPKALALLDDGKAHTFKNGQTWVKRDGQPVRLK